jgi:response regulator RpfG family c-di-GMP phosphodiesterase
LTAVVTPQSPPAPRTVLVVEDARDVREFFADVLEDAGYRVECTESVGDALRLLRTGRRIDVVVADYNLADGTGAELIHQASNEGYLDVELPPHVSLVHKPIDPRELLSLIARALDDVHVA